MSDGSISTIGKNSNGLVAAVKNNTSNTNVTAETTQSGGSITTSGEGANGLIAQTGFYDSTDPLTIISSFANAGVVTAKQTNGTISTNGKGSDGIVAIGGRYGTSNTEQAGTISLNADTVSANGIFAIAGGNVAVTQKAAGTITSKGDKVNGITAVSTGRNNVNTDTSVTVDVSGSIDVTRNAISASTFNISADLADSYPIPTSQIDFRPSSSVLGKSTITVTDDATIIGGKNAIYNDNGNSETTVGKTKSIKGDVRLNDGSDLLTFNVTDITQISLLDGGDDSLTPDTYIDVLTTNTVNTTKDGAAITNWEKIQLNANSILNLSGTLETGELNINASTLASNSDIVTIKGNVSNNGTIDLHKNTPNAKTK